MNYPATVEEIDLNIELIDSLLASLSGSTDTSDGKQSIDRALDARLQLSADRSKAERVLSCVCIELTPFGDSWYNQFLGDNFDNRPDFQL